jgi:hypothetical protein
MQSIKRFYQNKDFSDVEGTSPTPFIGRYGYPSINVGLLSLPERIEEAWLYDAPKYWAKNKFSIERIIGLRSSMLNSRSRLHVGSAKQRFQSRISDFFQSAQTVDSVHDSSESFSRKVIETTQQAAMVLKPMEVEYGLQKQPDFKLSLDSVSLPVGPSGNLTDLKAGTVPHVRRVVDKVHSDTDLNATQAGLQLYKRGYGEHLVTKMLSVGSIGVRTKRKFVPTRWAITATDDMLSKHQIKSIIDYPDIADYEFYAGSYQGNYFFVLLMPGNWAFELFEMYLPNASWNESSQIAYTTDFEVAPGRTKYASNCTGGYYAVRLPVTELLGKRKRRSAALVFRFITDEYTCPLGVFVCREATRIALSNKPARFSSESELFAYASQTISQTFSFNLQTLLAQSMVLSHRAQQRTLSQ